jgi:hypothetical protein
MMTCMEFSSKSKQLLTIVVTIIALLGLRTTVEAALRLVFGKADVLLASFVITAAILLFVTLCLLFLENKRLRRELATIFRRGPNRDAFNGLIRCFGMYIARQKIEMEIGENGNEVSRHTVEFVSRHIPLNSWQRTWEFTSGIGAPPSPSANVTIDGQPVPGAIQTTVNGNRLEETFTFSPPINRGQRRELSYTQRAPPGTYSLERSRSDDPDEDGLVWSIHEPTELLEIELRCRRDGPVGFYARAQFRDGRPLDQETLEVRRLLHVSRSLNTHVAVLTLEYPISGVIYEIGWKVPLVPAAKPTQAIGEPFS